MAAFTTHLSLGQVAFAVEAYGPCDYHVVRRTVGQIRVTETSPKHRFFQEEPVFKEEYMCVETGVGGGTIWTYGKNIFASEADAQAGVKDHEQRAHKQRAERDARVAEQRAREEERDRRELERLQAKYASSTGAARELEIGR